MITGSTGTELLKLSFDAYGQRRDRDWDGAISAADLTTLASLTRNGFTGHSQLDAVGLVHMNGRVYDPVLGRFLSVDPIVHPGVSQSAHPYAYVWNNPLTLTDPSGWSPTENITVTARRPESGQNNFKLDRMQIEQRINDILGRVEFGYTNSGLEEVTINGKKNRKAASRSATSAGPIRSPDEGSTVDGQPCERTGATENRSQLAFTSGLQGGFRSIVSGAKFSAQLNFGRQEWNAVGPNTVSQGGDVGIDVLIGRTGFDVERTAVGTAHAGSRNMYGDYLRSPISVDWLLRNSDWHVKPFAEYRGVEADLDYIVGIDISLLIGVKAQLDLVWLLNELQNTTSGCAET